MVEIVRNIRLEEFGDFMYFLNRSFGMSPGAFEKGYPNMYRPTPEMCSTAYIVERDGQIVSHVGLYPIEVVIDGISIPVGGIGGVATLPSARGKGYMTQLLYHVIDEMRAQGYPLSWLGGDRQRYNPFGWERAGTTYELVFSRRSLDRAGVEPPDIQGRFPPDALEIIERLQSLARCHANRPNLELELRKDGLSVWTMADGYVLVRGTAYGPLSILELVSASGQEAGMIRAVLEWTGRDDITWEISAWDEDRLVRLMPCVARWRAGGWQMYRIIDLYKLLSLTKPILRQRAVPLRDFAVSVGIREHDRLDSATISVANGDVEIAAGRSAESYVEWSSVDAARLILGGPPIAASAEVPAMLATLFPIPMYVPHLDHV